MRIIRKGDLGDFAIQDNHGQKLFILLKFSLWFFLLQYLLPSGCFFNWIARSQHFGFRSSLVQLATHFQTQSYEKKSFQPATDSLWQCLVHLAVEKLN